ncbi:MAG: bifunctional UDP-N-acetylmuramoyl-tripeptide:D-alanyl-D-alanine ligase/alanine racemase [Bacteroidetes bacterium]|nr:bifunctional UDP-N-acetylmuramoyl-tripeptide:D-alanyl-D-alanine ligase/alanine racemase [Bacteroidota bacterium]
MQYQISEICKILKGEAFLSNKNDIVKHISIDSRRITETDSILFFAIKGTLNDGHNYIKKLSENGIHNFVVTQIPENLKEKGLNFIKVKNTVKALQILCSHHRSTFNYKVIGIAGSNGKTIVKEWLYQILHEKFNIVRSPKSYNSQVGVPLSVWQMSDTNNLAIFEAGISKPGEMQLLEKIIKPHIGIFTNLGDAHSENFKSIKEKALEKLQLFNESEILICSKDNAVFNDVLSEFTKNKKLKILTWSKKDKTADLYIEKKLNNKHKAKYKGKSFIYSIPFTDEASFENAAICMLTAFYLGFDSKILIKKIAELHSVEMRLQKIEGINNNLLINDTYNSDINSLEISADFLVKQGNLKSNTVVLTDILQTEKGEKELYNTVNKILKSKHISKFIGIGKTISNNAESIKLKNKKFYLSTEEFIADFDLKSFVNENILIKGARNYMLERIVKLLEKQTHQTVFEINLSAIESNYKAIKSTIPPKTKIMGMVKAYSYGTGSYEVAKLLQDCGADYLCVAYIDEGIQLRERGIHIPIMVMNPDEKKLEKMLINKLEPEIYSFQILNSLIKTFENYKFRGIEKASVHIEIDTGMHRLGFMPDEADKLIKILNENKFLEVKSIFSHLAGSDESRLKNFTLNQIKVFEKTAKNISKNLSAKPLLHILNSSGIFHYKQASFDMVRAGIALYGIDPHNKNPFKLSETGTLKSYISQIKIIKEGEGISYGLHSKSKKERKIAIIAMGYADGLNRKLSNGNWEVIINGKFVPIVGNICMDMFMADISNAKCKEGDEVIIFGKQNSICEMAKSTETIPYEILTSISPRVKRIYWYE